MTSIPRLFQDLAGGINIEYSARWSLNANKHKVQRDAHKDFLLALTRVSIAALAVFAVLKWQIPIWKVLIATCTLSVPSALLFSAVVLFKIASVAGYATLITKTAVVIAGFSGPIIFESVLAKCLVTVSLGALGFISIYHADGENSLPLGLGEYLVNKLCK